MTDNAHKAREILAKDLDQCGESLEAAYLRGYTEDGRSPSPISQAAIRVLERVLADGDNQPTASGVSEEMVNIIEAAHNKALSCPSDYGIRRILREGLEAALSAKPAQGGNTAAVREMLKDELKCDPETLMGEWVYERVIRAIQRIAPPQPIPTPDEALPENADERRMFDDSVVAIFDGNPLKAIAFALELEWKILGREGSKACLCAIYANELRAAMSRVAALSRARPEAIRESALVSRGYLALIQGLLEECDKHLPITGSNFDDDMDLAREQTRLHLESRARPEEADSQDAAYILWFEDVGKEQILFSGFGAADAAHRAYAEAKSSWSCHLFKKVAPGAALAPAAEEAIREAALEEAAKVATGHIVDTRYRRWDCWPGASYGDDCQEVKLADAISLAIRALKSKSAPSPAPRISDAEIVDEFDKVSAFAEDERGRAWAYLDRDSALAFGRALLERK